MTNNILLNKFYSRMKDEASKSPMQYQLCAAIMKNKKMIGRPYCNTNTNTNQLNNKLCGSIHAEANAILHFFGKEKTRGAFYKKQIMCPRSTKKYDIIVIRVNRTGQTASARPCCECLRLMQNIGIHRVYYTSQIDNELICEKVSNMVSIQSSTVSKVLYCIQHRIFSDTDVYFKNLLQKHFPKFIKRKNFMYFVEHNFIHLFPTYKITIQNDVVIITDGKSIVLKSYLLH